MLPSYKYREPKGPATEDQRPMVRYLRFLHATDPPLERKTLQLSLQGSTIPMETAFCNPLYWMCEMETNKMFGRHLVADQDITEEGGRIIGCEHPILYVTAARDRCAECDRVLPAAGNHHHHQGIRCNKHPDDGHNNNNNNNKHNCPLAFCSEACRDWAWEHYHKVQDHQRMAALYAHGGGNFLDVLFVLKGLAMMELPNINKDALSYIEAFLQNPHLHAYAEQINVVGPGILTVVTASGFTKVKGDGLSDLVGKLFGLKHLYSFGDGEVSYLFGPTCCINHSCEENVVVRGLQGHDSDASKPFAVIEALRPIQKGEQLVFNYRRESMTPWSARKANIMAQYGFECHCRLCNDGIPRCDYEGCRAENDDLKRCKKCKNAVYCNRTCQAKDWKHHKQYCGLKAAGHCI